MNKTCSKCGKEVGAEVKYCPQCGGALLPEWEMGIRKEIRYVSAGCGGCLTLLLAIIFFLLFLSNVPSIVAFVIASIAAITPCIFYCMAILWLDRHEKEPVYLLLAAFLWGALVSTIFSYIVNSINAIIIAQVTGLDLSAILSAPWVEETSKGAALLILFIFMRHEFDNVTDGIIYGSLVGMGFAMAENIIYFGRNLASGGLLGLGVIFYVRAILGAFGHALYTGTTGAGLGFARQTRHGLPVKIIVPILAFGLAVTEHFIWNFAATFSIPTKSIFVKLFIILPLHSIILTLPIFIAILAIAYFALRQEKGVIREKLADELKSGVILPDEYEALIRGGRFRREWEILWQKGLAPWYYLRKLYQLEIDLAFRKWHTSRGEKLKGIQRVYSEDAIRKQIAGVRKKLT